jgi:hypothetical protein
LGKKPPCWIRIGGCALHRAAGIEAFIEASAAVLPAAEPEDR